jgi:large subunit ribosomal protein L10
MTVICSYKGLTVAEMQELRSKARENSSKVIVAKNRLLRHAVAHNEKLKSLDLTSFTGQVLYIFNSEDEVAPASLAKSFSKDHPSLVIEGAFSMDPAVHGKEDTVAIASLPSKDVLRSQLVGTFAAPLSGFMNVLNGNLRGFLNVLNAKAEKN